MAIDGAFLHNIKQELKTRLSETRVDKIHQPSKEELVFSLRNRQGTYKLYISVRVNSPRVHLTQVSLENPASPPMFCMLLRKHLTGARLTDIRQPALERVLFFDFDTYNELGDAVQLTLVTEIMGRYSNLILIDENEVIIDVIKRVDFTMSPVRPLLPGMPYRLPPVDRVRTDLLTYSVDEVIAAVMQHGGKLDKAFLATTQGMSPLVCREIAFRVLQQEDTLVENLTMAQTAKLREVLVDIQRRLQTDHGCTPYVVYRTDKTPWDFSFMPILQYGWEAFGREAENFSSLLDDFYAEKDATERMHQQSHDILKVLSNASDRLSRKLQFQREELAVSAERDIKRLYGDLINSNIHAIPHGAGSVELMNYYDEDCKTVRIPLDPSLSASQNAQKYYKDYRKARTAEEMLNKQIALGEEELRYIDTVFDALSRASTQRELEELREELASTGYLKRRVGKRKLPPPSKPLEFVSDDGFTILVGRNNVQNDTLTTRTAKGSDWWFHTKNIPGSHTVILTEGVTPPETTLLQAAVLAATHSKAADSSQVPVDYTQIKYVKKPAGAKPGMVIYETNRTVYVTPDRELAARLTKTKRQ